MRSEKILQTCKQCGNPFEVNRSRLRYGKGKVCSPACQYASMHRPPREVRCGQCGATFLVPESNYRFREKQGSPPRYCSHRCAHAAPDWKKNLGESLKASTKARAARKRMVEAARLSPHRPEGAKKAWQDPAKRARIMAGIAARSQNPAWRNAPHFRCGPAHPRYKGNRSARAVERSQYRYKAWVKAVYRRDDWTCQHCRQRGGRLNAHHIKPWAQFPRLRYVVGNGLTLCEVCHEKLHATV